MYQQHECKILYGHYGLSHTCNLIWPQLWSDLARSCKILPFAPVCLYNCSCCSRCLHRRFEAEVVGLENTNLEISLTEYLISIHDMEHYFREYGVICKYGTPYYTGINIETFCNITAKTLRQTMDENSFQLHDKIEITITQIFYFKQR